MSEGIQYTGGFVNGRCYAREALEDGPPLYFNGDFHFQGAPYKWHISSQIPDARIAHQVQRSPVFGWSWADQMCRWGGL